MDRRTPSYVWLIVVLALTVAAAAVVIAAPALARGSEPARAPSSAQVADGVTTDGTARTITVLGSATVTRVPDGALVTIDVIGRAENAADAQSVANRTARGVVLAMRALEIPNADIKTRRIALEEVFTGRGADRRLVGYRGVHNLEVKTAEEKAGQVLDAATDAGAAGTRVTLYVTEPEEALDQARLRALRDARRKATAMATEMDVRIIRVQEIHDGSALGSGPFNEGFGDVGGGGGRDPSVIFPGTTEIGAIVQVVFEIE